MIEIIEGNLGQSCKKNTISPIFTIPTTIITRPKPKEKSQPWSITLRITEQFLPMLFRNIEYSLYKDATSVYGYPGPITKNIISDSDYGLFHKELHRFLREQNIISVFTRLNAFLKGPMKTTCAIVLKWEWNYAGKLVPIFR